MLMLLVFVMHLRTTGSGVQLYSELTMPQPMVRRGYLISLFTMRFPVLYGRLVML